MLLFFRDRKKIEDDQKNEEIIGAEGNFQNVTSDELKRYLASLPEIKKDGERSGEDNVDCAPSQGGAKTDGPAGTMQAQVQQQHCQREHVEEDPEIEQGSREIQN